MTILAYLARDIVSITVLMYSVLTKQTMHSWSKANLCFLSFQSYSPVFRMASLWYRKSFALFLAFNQTFFALEIQVLCRVEESNWSTCETVLASRSLVIGVKELFETVWKCFSKILIFFLRLIFQIERVSAKVLIFIPLVESVECSWFH